MSAGCNQVISSRIKVAIVPNITCAAKPFAHRVTFLAAASGASQVSIALDSAYTAGGYTVDSKFPLVAGTTLLVGSQLVEIAAPTDGSGVYFITTTTQLVNVVRLTAAITLAATASTYFAVPLCLKSANVTTNSTQVDNTTNCTGTLFTQINTGFMKMLDLAGFLASADYGYELLSSLGVDLQSVFFAIDYDRRFLTAGVAQLTDPSITDSVVKQLAGYTIQGQIQSIDESYGSYLSAAEITALAATRNLYGFKPAVGVVTVA